MVVDKKFYQSLKDMQRVCLKQNIPFASYRLPLQSDITTLVQHKSFPEKIDNLSHIEQKSGFIIAPIFDTNKHHTYILEPDRIFFLDKIEEEFIQDLLENNFFISIVKSSGNEIVTTSSRDFIHQANDAKEAISEGKFHKVVLSKVRIEKLRDDFEASTFFLHLCEKYPNAFVYMIQLPEVGCWIGATPEPLVVIEGGKVKTVSLAGTQLAVGNQIASKTDIESYQWSEKEIEEQGIVTDFVEQTLRSLQIDNYTLNGPASYQAGNLIHLKTSFEFEEVTLKNRLGEFIKAIHPTPSVGGLPRDAARDFILKNEKHDRSYYTGFLGTLNIDNKSSLFVNLRCLQLFEKHFVLYSGAGITAASIAEKEWEETENKMLTMMNVMKNI